MKPLAPTDFRAFLQRLHRAFASKENTILAQVLILTLVMMIFAVEASLNALSHIR